MPQLPDMMSSSTLPSLAPEGAATSPLPSVLPPATETLPLPLPAPVDTSSAGSSLTSRVPAFSAHDFGTQNQERISGTTTVRLAFAVPKNRIDLKLPGQTSLSNLREEIIKQLRKETEGNLELERFFSEPAVKYSFISGIETLDWSKSFSDQRITDGSVIEVRRVRANEKFSPVIDDHAAAMPEYLDKSFPRWTNEDARKLILHIIPFFALVFSVGTVYEISVRHFFSFMRWPLLGLFSLIVITCIGFAGIFTRFGVKERFRADPRVLSLMLTALASGLAIGPLALPRPLGQYTVVITLCVLTIIAFSMVGWIKDQVSLSYGVGIVTGVSALVSSLVFIFPLSAVNLSALVTLAALTTLNNSQRIAQSCAGIELPRIPAAGEDILTAKEKQSTASATSTAAVNSILNLEANTRQAYRVLLGISVATSVIAGFALAIMGYSLSNDDVGSWTARYRLLLGAIFALSACSFFFSRARWNVDRAIEKWSIVSILGVYLAFLAGLGARHAGGYGVYFATGVGILIVGLIISVIVVFRNAPIASPVVMKLIELVEWTMCAIAFGVIAFLLNVYQLVRTFM